MTLASYTVVLRFVCKECLHPNVQKKRIESADKETALVRASNAKIFCNNPECEEQMYGVTIHLDILASTPDEIATISIEPPSGSA